MRGNGIGDSGREGPLATEDGADEEAGVTPRLYDMTMQMFEPSGKIWAAEGRGTGNETARNRYAEMQAWSVRHAVNHELALHAAKASDKAAASTDEDITGLIGPAGATVKAVGGRKLK